MKYIVTETQYNRLIESDVSHLKKLMFKYWDTHQQNFSSTFYKLFNIDEWDNNEEEQVKEFYLEWLGGIEKVYELMKNAEGDTMNAQGGTYNFRFKIKDVEMGNENTEVFYNILIDGDGDVEINVGTDYQPEIIDNIYDGITNPDIGWEVKDEVIDIIKETVREQVVDYQCELSSFEVGNKRDF